MLTLASPRLHKIVVTLLALAIATLFTTISVLPAFAEDPSDGGGSSSSDAGGAMPSVSERTLIYDETGLIDQESILSVIGNIKNVPGGTHITILVTDTVDPANYDQSVAQRLEAHNREVVNGGQLQVNQVIIAISPAQRKLGFYVGDANPYPAGVKDAVIGAMKPHAQSANWDTAVIAGLNAYFMSTAPGGEVIPVAPSSDSDIDSAESGHFGMPNEYWIMIGVLVGAPMILVGPFFAASGIRSMKRKSHMRHLAAMTPRGRRLWENTYRPELEGYVTAINAYEYDVNAMTYVPRDEREDMKREIRESSKKINALISDAGGMRANAATILEEARSVHRSLESKITSWGRGHISEHVGTIQEAASQDSSARSRLNQQNSTQIGDIWVPLFLIHYVASQTPGTTAYAAIHTPTSASSSSSSYSTDTYSSGSFGGFSGGSDDF